MDIVPYVAAAQAFVGSHPLADTALGFVFGGLAANPLLCADLTFAAVEKVPPLRYLITKNWPAISAFLDRFQERFAQDVKKSESAEQPSGEPGGPKPPAVA